MPQKKDVAEKAIEAQKRKNAAARDRAVVSIAATLLPGTNAALIDLNRDVPGSVDSPSLEDAVGNVQPLFGAVRQHKLTRGRIEKAVEKSLPKTGMEMERSVRLAVARQLSSFFFRQYDRFAADRVPARGRVRRTRSH